MNTQKQSPGPLLVPDPFLVELGERIGERPPGSFYMVNTLVDTMDGSRILGPLTGEQLEGKVAGFNKIVGRLSDTEAAKYPLKVYKHVDGSLVPYEMS
tara:strand:+ start:550 stop:843 length:294 start_codon:yes stop_codon:yes gene_type:complete